MSEIPRAHKLISALASTPEMAAIFADVSVLQAMLDFEAALARAEAACGVVPHSAARAITLAARAEHFSAGELAQQGLRAGTLAIPLVKALTAGVRGTDAESARYAHWGATSQDMADTAMVLLLRRVWHVLAQGQERLAQELRQLSDQHTGTVMLGRTLLQSAPPVTFGLKAAGWHGSLERSWERLDGAFQQSMAIQLGGASGTLASLGTDGIAVAAALASELELQNPGAPWHTHRDRFATLVCACGVYVGALAKMARDISLLMQFEVGEVAEPGGDGRGGSSTMPHKRNPVACALTLAAGTRVPGLVATFLTGMAQEHERALGGWQAEWATLARVLEDTGLAQSSMVEATAGLEVNVARMRGNLAATGGVIFAERAMMLLGAKLGRDVAHQMLEAAVQLAVRDGRALVDVLAEDAQVASVLTAAEIRSLDVPEEYLGAAEVFRRRLLRED